MQILLINPLESRNCHPHFFYQQSNDGSAWVTIRTRPNAYFLVSSTKSKIDYKVLEDYLLFYDREKETLEAVRKQILNALLKILRIENITDTDKKDYTKRKLLNELKNTHFDAYEALKLHIYNWSMLCINERINEACLSMRNYIPTFLALWGQGQRI